MNTKDAGTIGLVFAAIGFTALAAIVGVLVALVASM